MLGRFHDRRANNRRLAPVGRRFDLAVKVDDPDGQGGIVLLHAELRRPEEGQGCQDKDTEHEDCPTPEDKDSSTYSLERWIEEGDAHWRRLLCGLYRVGLFAHGRVQWMRVMYNMQYHNPLSDEGQ